MSHVLIVEDEPALLEVLVEAITDFGHKTTSAENAEEGLRLVRLKRPDLLITGHMMPGRTGAELVRELRKERRFQDLPILVMSISLRPEALPDDVPFLRKPFDMGELERCVTKLLKQPRRARSG